MGARGEKRANDSALVGRDAELARLEELVLGGARLIAVTGVAGVGKSRLALAMADRARARDELEVLVLALREVSTSGDAFVALALALGTEPDHPALVEQIARALSASGPLLVVLDGLDALGETLAPPIQRWLDEALELQVLITSRRRLRLADETLFTVQPLSLPEGDNDFASSAAVKMWVARTQRVDPSYQLGADAPVVAELVRKLDGLPLAIELAAARGNLLGAREQLARLDRRFELLRASAGPEGGLQAALASSWELLTADERSALGQCTVFRGGFTIAAAETVLVADRPAGELIEALIDESLLQVERDSLGERRFALLLSVRELAIGSTSEDQIAAARARHLAHFAGQARRLLIGEKSLDSLKPLLERENLCAAAEWALETGILGAALDCLEVLERGNFEAPEALTISAADRTDLASAPADVRARALRLRAGAHARAHRFDAARTDYESSAALSAQAGALAGEGWAKLGLAVRVARPIGRLEEATVLARRALACSETDRALEIESLRALAELGRQRGRADECLDAIDRALRVAQARGDRDAEVHHFEQLAWQHAQSGDSALALEYANRALTEAKALGANQLLARLEAVIGTAEMLRGNLDLATKHLETAIAESRRRRDLRTFGLAAAYLGWACFIRGESSRAALLARDAATSLQMAGDARYEAFVRGGLAFVEASSDRIEAAEASLLEAERLSASHEDDLLATAISLCRARLELALAHRAERRGDQAGHDKLIAIARERLAHASQPQDGETASARQRAREVEVLGSWLETALTAPTAVESSKPKNHLRIAKNGYWFEPEDAPRVDLARRIPMARMLVALAEAHAQKPGTELDAPTLIERTWPGERMAWDAAQNRLHVTISRLRTLGLRSSMRSTGNGYCLEPSLHVEIVD